ncbi:hypothetical protein [Paractinoplanes lichenicola]|uniref:Ankyrin repeat domain-containing protein n=1 Tax=Paractinoplanes lichenicola TaxID=2802976 RepID=A0ABS1VQN9_9ACTN|nr:hypothetical protein [Actinoplanes lichenicola]MBL7255856.1 hypothetical protein [Actinoplanes lichenicola]
MFLAVLSSVMIAVLVAAFVIIGLGMSRYSAPKRAAEEQRRQDKVLRARVDAVLAAATGPDRPVVAGDLGLQNPDGDSALHLAYHAGRDDAVARLVALGADETLRNHDGLTPAEMVEVAAIERLLERTVACMTRCRWRDAETGRTLYESLLELPLRLYNPALVRVALRNPESMSLACLGLKVGKPGSEERLVPLLDGLGSKAMATKYLNSGSQVLADAAFRWARANGYVIQHTGGGTGVRWGRF